MNKLSLICVLIVFGLSGCASTEQNLRRETASKTENIRPNQVSTLSVDRGVTNVTKCDEM